MKKSEFIISVASERQHLEIYAEMPDGSYEWLAKNAKSMIPILDYALAGLERFNRPVTPKNLEEQFIYCFHLWRHGEIKIEPSGKIRKMNATSEESRTHRKALYEIFSQYVNA